MCPSGRFIIDQVRRFFLVELEQSNPPLFTINLSPQASRQPEDMSVAATDASQISDIAALVSLIIARLHFKTLVVSSLPTAGAGSLDATDKIV